MKEGRKDLKTATLFNVTYNVCKNEGYAVKKQKISL